MITPRWMTNFAFAISIARWRSADSRSAKAGYFVSFFGRSSASRNANCRSVMIRIRWMCLVFGFGLLQLPRYSIADRPADDSGEQTEQTVFARSPRPGSS